METLEQKRAAFAWKQVRNNCNEDYRRAAKAAPVLIMNCGLMQTLAFFKSKGNDQILGDILSWLQKRFEGFPSDFQGAMKKLFEKDGRFYIQATEETLALLRWLRQFADAVK